MSETSETSEITPVNKCVCGEPATTVVAVRWATTPGERRPNRRRRYRYCEARAADVVFAIEGAEVVADHWCENGYTYVSANNSCGYRVVPCQACSPGSTLEVHP